MSDHSPIFFFQILSRSPPRSISNCLRPSITSPYRMSVHSSISCFQICSPSPLKSIVGGGILPVSITNEYGSDTPDVPPPADFGAGLPPPPPLIRAVSLARRIRADSVRERSAIESFKLANTLACSAGSAPAAANAPCADRRNAISRPSNSMAIARFSGSSSAASLPAASPASDKPSDKSCAATSTNSASSPNRVRKSAINCPIPPSPYWSSIAPPKKPDP